MNRRNRVLLCALLVAVVACSSAAAGLLEYVARPEPQYQWSKVNETAAGQVKVVDLAMTSQVWQGIPWKHTVRIYVPSEISYPQSALLMITGGNPGAEDMMYGPIIAQRIEAPFAILFNIPNQPLFQGLTEDRLIAYTFSKFLETGDDTWPLLLPMTKSAIKAMDALQAFARKEWQRELTSFVVTGASKRGWTTWLTGAADQQRVKGIAPMVIDTLNMPAQMPHQLEMFGSYSAEISEYSERSLQAAMSSPQGAALTKMVDPYSYRERITMPKLIINGANDPYWATDALNLYWEGLAGPKWVLYVPNAGHGLEDRRRVLNALGAFSEAVAAGKSLPDMSWQYADAGDNLTLTITARPQPVAARMWIVHSPDLDFRNDHWEATPMQQQGGSFVGAIAKPTADNVAVFGEAEFNVGGHTLTLSTQMRVAPGLPTAARQIIAEEHKRLLEVYRTGGEKALLAELQKTEPQLGGGGEARTSAEPGWRQVGAWSGTGITSTQTFTVGSEWRIRWSNAPQQSGMGYLGIHVCQPGNDLPVELAANTAEPGNDTTHIHRSGTFYLAVNAANTRWTVAVEERQ